MSVFFQVLFLIFYCFNHCTGTLPTTSLLRLQTMTRLHVACSTYGSTSPVSSSTALPIRWFRRPPGSSRTSFRRTPALSNASFSSASSSSPFYVSTGANCALSFLLGVDFWGFNFFAINCTVEYIHKITHQFSILFISHKTEIPTDSSFIKCFASRRWLFHAAFQSCTSRLNRTFWWERRFRTTGWRSLLLAVAQLHPNRLHSISTFQYLYCTFLHLYYTVLVFMTQHVPRSSKPASHYTRIHIAAAHSGRKRTRTGGGAPVRHWGARLSAARSPWRLRAPLSRVPLALRTATRSACPVGALLFASGQLPAINEYSLYSRNSQSNALALRPCAFSNALAPSAGVFVRQHLQYWCVVIIGVYSDWVILLTADLWFWW